MEDFSRLASDAAAVRDAIAAARVGLVDREVVAEVAALCAVAREHLLVVGAPGTAKSEAVRRVAWQVGGRYFEYLLGRFTEPHEIFGPVDLRRLREGVVEIATGGMLPEAEVAFLDEVFLGSTAILNTLLGLLNERVFRHGGTVTKVPLRVCVGATNVLPEDPALAAFADRFLARIFVEPVADARLEELLEQGARGPEPAGSGCALAALDRLASAAEQCDLSEVRPLLGAAVRRIRAPGVLISDRRAVRSQNLIAAAAVLDARMTAAGEDLWVLPLIVPTADAQAAARDLLADLLQSSRNASLAHAAEEFSRGAHARAERLTRTGRELLDEFGSEAAADRDARSRFEATLREIDAGFAAEDLPESLRGVRAELIAAVQT